MKIIFLFALMSNILLAGSKGIITSLPITDLPYSPHLNVAYGSDPKQVMDIYLPAGRSTTSTKVMFLIHGGGWSGGDKRDFLHYIDSLQKYLPDYAFVNINYRLANFSQNKFPTQEQDVNTALRYVTNRSQEFSISEKVVLLGASAGAHLALLQAYKHAQPVKAGAVISFFGPADMNYVYNHPANTQVPLMIKILMGGTPDDTPQIYQQSSPINFVTNQSCPTLILHGGKDPVVSPEQSLLLKDKLQSAGVPNKLILYPNEGHGWGGLPLGDSFRNISDFVREHVK